LILIRQVKEVSKDRSIKLPQDMISYAMLCMYKPNVEKFKITPKTQAMVLKNALTCILF